MKNKRTIVDISEFRARVGRGHKPGVGVRAVVGRFLPASEQSIEEGSRVRKFIFSDGSIDRYGDTINPRGWVYDKSAGSVALFGHNASEVENVIGRTQDEGVDGDNFVGSIRFATAEENPAADMVLRLIDGGYINSVSVGFQPLEWKQTKDKSRPGGIDFMKQELLEVSVVPIPANRNALQQAKAAGIAIERLGLVAPAPLPIATKGLYEVSWLAMLLADLGYLQDCVEWEAEYEGDGSEVPAKLAAALAELGQVLIEMTAEEVAEMVGAEEDEDPAILADDPVEMAAWSPAQKALAKLAAIGRRARTIMKRAPQPSASIERAGKVLSAANETSLRDAHDLITKGCGMVKAVFDQATAEDPEPDADDPSKSAPAAPADDIAIAARARRERIARVHRLRAVSL